MWRKLVRAFDRWISRQLKIFVFSDEPDCILRAQVIRARHAVYLPEVHFEVGDMVLMLHLWNEHLPTMPASGPDLAWANRTWRSFVGSLHRLAQYLHQRPEIQIRAIGGISALFTLEGDSGARLMQRLGFVFVPYRSKLGRFGEFWENLYAWFLLWAFNPASRQSHRLFDLRRTEMWMERGEFIRRFLDKR